MANGKMWSFHSLLFPSSRSHSHSRETSLAIPIPMGFPWDPWEFPYYDTGIPMSLMGPMGMEIARLVSREWEGLDVKRRE